MVDVCKKSLLAIRSKMYFFVRFVLLLFDYIGVKFTLLCDCANAASTTCRRTVGISYQWMKWNRNKNITSPSSANWYLGKSGDEPSEPASDHSATVHGRFR